MEIERRSYNIQEFRVDTPEDGKGTMIVGHAAVFNQLSEDLGGFREQIAPGAFAETILVDDIRALFNHNPDYVLGRNRSTTLRLSEDAIGLKIEIDIPDTQFAKDLMVSMTRGDISQMSFGFTVPAGSSIWEDQPDGTVIRTIKKCSLFDVSPVTYPAYPQTDCAVRSLNDWKEQKTTKDEGFEKTLRAYFRAKSLETLSITETE